MVGSDECGADRQPWDFKYEHSPKRRDPEYINKRQEKSMRCRYRQESQVEHSTNLKHDDLL